MQISSTTALPSHASPIQSERVNLRSDADMTPEQLAKADLPDKEKIGGLCRQFEAVLLRQILTAAQKSVIKSDLIQESAASGIYQSMVTDQLADAISKSGSFGFARSLEQELTRQLGAAKDAGGSHEK